MDLVMMFLVGALAGWLASLVTRSDDEMGIVLNVVAGITGAFLARIIFGSLFGISSAEIAGTFTILGVLWGILGAVIIIGVAQGLRLIK